MTDNSLTCWVISDGRRGIENQALGLAEAAARLKALEIHCHIIETGKTLAAASPKLQFALKSKPTDYGLPKRFPDLAIGCGRQAIAPLMALKKASPNIFTAYVQAPRLDPSHFDIVFAPEHDSLSGPNVETMIGSPNRVTNTLIIGQTLHFAKKLENLPMPRVAMLIGGPSKTHKLGKTEHKAHLDAAHKALAQGYSLMITASRRTPMAMIKDYQRLASDFDNVWLYDGEGENPYYAFLGGADSILVTEDSTNMLTEACATGKPVFRLPMAGQAGKFEALYKALSKRCYLDIFSEKFQSKSYEPLEETDRIASQFWARYDNRTVTLN